MKKFMLRSNKVSSKEDKPSSKSKESFFKNPLGGIRSNSHRSSHTSSTNNESITYVGKEISAEKPQLDVPGQYDHILSSANNHTEQTAQKQTLMDQLRTKKKSREKILNDQRIQELKDQNEYLMDKVQFLKMQKMRNEQEIDRMDTKQIELKKIHDMYSQQLNQIETLILEWQQFHSALTSASEAWHTAAASSETRDNNNNNNVVGVNYETERPPLASASEAWHNTVATSDARDDNNDAVMYERQDASNEVIAAIVLPDLL